MITDAHQPVARRSRPPQRACRRLHHAPDRPRRWSSGQLLRDQPCLSRKQAPWAENHGWGFAGHALAAFWHGSVDAHQEGVAVELRTPERRARGGRGGAPHPPPTGCGARLGKVGWLPAFDFPLSQRLDQHTHC